MRAKVVDFVNYSLHCVTVDNSTLRIAERFYIHSLTTASGSRLFGSVVDHWIIDPAARVRFSPKSWNCFSLICYALFFVAAFMS